MAHMLKLKKNDLPGEIGHVFRCRETKENVDRSLSYLNEYYATRETNDVYKLCEEELSKCKVQNRQNVNVLVSWVVTLPKDIEPGSEEEGIFFDTTREFLKERYPDTYLGDAIHRDEPKSRPHMHYLLIPKVKEIKNEKVRDSKTGKLKKTGRRIETGRMKVSLDELITRNDLIRFHDDLNDMIKQALGREVQILTGTTKENGGNMNLTQYRAEMAQRDAKKAQAKAQEAEQSAKIAQMAATKEKEQYRKLSVNFEEAKAKKIEELNQREKVISEAEAAATNTQTKANEALESANAEKAANIEKAEQLRQEEINLRLRLKKANDAQAAADKKAAEAEKAKQEAAETLNAANEQENKAAEKEAAADAALKTAKITAKKEAEKIITEAEAEASKIRTIADEMKATAEEKLNIAEEAQKEAEQTRRAADDALARAETTLKTAQKREEAVKIREAALEDTRPDIKAARLNREIKAIEAEISKIEAMPQSKEEVEIAAYTALNPEIGKNSAELTKMIAIIKKAKENYEHFVIYDDAKYNRYILEKKASDKYNEIRCDKEKIYRTPELREKHQQLQIEIKKKTIQEQKRLPELHEKYEQKCEEYAFYGGAAIDLLIKAAPKWQEIAPEIEAICRKHLPKEKTVAKIKTSKNRGFER